MKYILFTILLVAFSGCSNNENIEETNTIKENVLVDVSSPGIYSMCAECHGTDGKNRAFGRSKVIAGWDASRVEKSIYAIINGTYKGPMSGIMRTRVQNLSDEEIKEVSIYVSKLK